MPLAMLKIGDEARIASIAGNDETRKRLETLGVRAGYAGAGAADRGGEHDPRRAREPRGRREGRGDADSRGGDVIFGRKERKERKGTGVEE